MSSTLGASTSTTSAFLARRTLRPVFFFCSRWLRNALRRTNLPLPVRLKRLAAARRVFSFGMITYPFFNTVYNYMLRCSFISSPYPSSPSSTSESSLLPTPHTVSMSIPRKKSPYGRFELGGFKSSPRVINKTRPYL